MLEEEQELTREEGDAEDNINCMEDEVDPSFLTQSDYEESLMNEHITEESLYQADDQGGYNLRSKIASQIFLIVAPGKKNLVPTKQSGSPIKKLSLLQKRLLFLQNSSKGHCSHHSMIKSILKLHHKR